LAIDLEKAVLFITKWREASPRLRLRTASAATQLQLQGSAAVIRWAGDGVSGVQDPRVGGG
jgi:hypothetical protein